MPRPIKKIPRRCTCGKHQIKQPYFSTCTWCRRSEKRLRKDRQRLTMEFRQIWHG